MDAAFGKCLSRLQRLCSKAEYCTADLYRKALKDLEGDASAAAEVVSALVAERYADDARYAAAFAREKALLQGWGPVKIRFQLRGKGIPEEAVAAALAQLSTDEAADRLDKLLAAKARSLAGDPQRRLKLIKCALSRGYEYDRAEAAVKKLL